MVLIEATALLLASWCFRIKGKYVQLKPHIFIKDPDTHQQIHSQRIKALNIYTSGRGSAQFINILSINLINLTAMGF